MDRSIWPPPQPISTQSTLALKDEQHQAVYGVAAFATAYGVSHHIRCSMFAHEAILSTEFLNTASMQHPSRPKIDA